MSTPTLAVISTERLVPPFNGANKKAHDILIALKGSYNLEVITYERPGVGLGELESYWGTNGPRFHVLKPNRWFCSLRAIVTGTLRTAHARRPGCELRLLRGLLNEGGSVRLLVDNLSAASVVRHYACGVVISCSDCASEMFRAERQLNDDPIAKAQASWRGWGSKRLEKRYLHLADAVHVVKRGDGECLKRIDARIKPVTIPLASIGALTVTAASPRSVALMPRILIWGNLGLGAIRSGFIALVRALERAGKWETARFTVLGRVPRGELEKSAGALPCEMDYVERADDLDAFLSRQDIVVLPDLGGSGQKHRCLDLLRLGKCIVGFEHPFEDLPEHDRRYYVRCRNADELVAELASLLASGSWCDIGAEGRQIFLREFSLERFRQRWCSLLESIPALVRK